MHNLNGYLKEHGISQSAVARVLNISRQCFNNKLRLKTEFKASEIRTIALFLRLNHDEIERIFLLENVNEKNKQS